jgi:hypothetical protein
MIPIPTINKTKAKHSLPKTRTNELFSVGVAGPGSG